MVALVGTATIGLGIWHLGVPRWFDYAGGVASSAGDLGVYRFGPFAYSRWREDLVGLAWVMSNVAAFVLVSIGVVDLAWAAGDRTIPLGLGGPWIAAFWALRAVSQLAIGRRRIDLVFVAVFAGASAVHAGIALMT
jgi:hypothetical protein